MEKDMNLDKSIVLKVNGMHCGGCANKIKKGLETLNIEQTSDINVESSTVKIKFNSAKSTIATLKGCIESAGFQVESVEIE
jgi:copper chaperone